MKSKKDDMNKRLLLTGAFIVALLLASCAPEDSQPATPTSPARTATISDINNNVQARDSESEEYSAAVPGQRLQIGGQARSGEDSRARLDLVPEGSIIRLGPTSEFTLNEFNNDTQDPFTRLKLVVGQLWVILNGGSMEIETDIGTASVRGSLMGVHYDPIAQSMSATCLEGNCSLTNAAGQTEMLSGQAADIPAPAQPPSDTRPIQEDELQDWVENNPEAVEFLPPTPTPAPFTYKITNKCNDAYHYIISGPNGFTEFLVGAGEMVSGELPPGDYAYSFWREGFPETRVDRDFHSGATSVEIVNCSKE